MISYTSVLTRAIQTADLALHGADRAWIPVKRSWRLNERHYGALQGLDKAETLAKYGEEQFMTWRRSFDVPPPPLADDAEWSQFGDERYADMPGRRLPAHREPQARDRQDAALLAVGHHPVRCARAPCSSPRTATRCARSSSTSTASRDDEIAELNIPTGIPLVYELDDDFMPTAPARYLDPEAAAAGAAAVAAQGKK